MEFEKEHICEESKGTQIRFFTILIELQTFLERGEKIHVDFKATMSKIRVTQ